MTSHQSRSRGIVRCRLIHTVAASIVQSSAPAAPSTNWRVYSRRETTTAERDAKTTATAVTIACFDSASLCWSEETAMLEADQNKISGYFSDRSGSMNKIFNDRRRSLTPTYVHSSFPISPVWAQTPGVAHVVLGHLVEVVANNVVVQPRGVSNRTRMSPASGAGFRAQTGSRDVLDSFFPGVVEEFPVGNHATGQGPSRT
jgi:hypothetical protein